MTLYNRVRAVTATTGTGTITLGEPVSGYFPFHADSNIGWAGVTDGDTVPYVIEDGNHFEIGKGAWSSSARTLTRLLSESSTGSLLSLSGRATAFISSNKDFLAGRERICVDDYYLAGDTYYNSAFTAALAACAVLGAALFIPGKSTVRNLNDTVTIPAGVAVFGDGYNSHVRQTAAEKNVFNLGSNCMVDRVRLEGDGLQTSIVDWTKNNGVFAQNVTGVSVTNSFFHGFRSAGVQIQDGVGCHVAGNLCYGNYYGQNNSSDIVFYSSTRGGSSSIVGNRCFSNNSQGIWCNPTGFDGDLAIVGNICITMNSSFAELASGSLSRRHGILVNYGSPGGRITVSGNVCKNTLITGIYTATSSGTKQKAIIITGNVCSKNGFAGAGASDSTLSGGITVNGGADLVQISDNAITDFRGNLTNAIGAITFNGYNGADSVFSDGCNILNNTIDTSTAYGIAINNNPVGKVNVRGNHIKRCTSSDIRCNPGSDWDADLYIEDNTCERSSNNIGSIYVDDGGATRRRYVRRNKIYGADRSTYDGSNNAAIHLRQATKFTVTDNHIEKFYFGVYYEDSVTGRVTTDYIIDRNHFDDVETAIRLRGASSAPMVILQDNTFETVGSMTNTDSGTAVGYIGRRQGAKVVVQTSAAPAVGTWVAGDRAEFTAPAAGAAPGAVCTTGGNPGTWKDEASLAA